MVTETNKKKQNVFYKIIKRAFDLISSLLLSILISPFFLVIAILVKSEDGGNVFYKHERIGIYGKKIGVYKLRSMMLKDD